MPYDGKIVFDGTWSLNVFENNGTDPEVHMSASTSYTNFEGDPKTLGVAGSNNLRGETIALLEGMTIDITVSLVSNGNCVFSGGYTIPYTVEPLAFNNDQEPNDDENQAIVTQENTYYQGHGRFYPYDLTANDDQNDIYKLTATRDGTLTIDVNSDTTTEDNYDTYVHITSSLDGNTTSNGNRVWSSPTSNPPNGTETGQINCVKAGDVIFIKITGTANSYRFKWSIESPIGFIDTEPNNTITEAIHINLSETKTGSIGYGLIPAGYKNQYPNVVEDHEDWYKVVLIEPGDLQINIDASEELYNFANNTLYKEDENGNLGSSVALSGDLDNGFAVSCLSPGNYYIKLQTNPSSLTLIDNGCESCCITYSLTVNHSNVPTYSNDTEPNNSYNDAIIVSEGSTQEGQLGYKYYYGSSYDNYDYYKFTINNNGALNITFTEPLPANSVTLHADNQNKNQAGNIHTNSNGEFTGASFDCAKAGESYFLAINANTCMSYQFTYSNTPDGTNNEQEPNDTKGQAQTFNSNDTINGHVGYGYINNWDRWDHYIIPVTDSAPLDIDLNINGNAYIYLYENNLPKLTLTQDENSGPITSLNYNNTDASKTYILGILFMQNNGCAYYTLNGWTQQFTASNDSEPNNTKAQATAANFEQEYSGQLSFYSTGSDIQDFYSFTLDNTDNVQFILNAYEGLDGTGVLTVFNSATDSQVFQLTHDGTNTARTSNIASLLAGDYYVTITGSDQTGSYSFSMTPQNELSIDKTKFEKQIHIYPNPTKQIINADIPTISGNVELIIHDILGKVVHTVPTLKPSNQIDVSKLQNGLYFATFKTKSSIVTKRFIKQ